MVPRGMPILMVCLLLAPAALVAGEITPESVIAGMNARRAERGLPPLREDSRLVAAAQDRIRDMEEQGYWSHVSPDGRSPFECMRPRGYDFSYAAENLAAGFETTEVLMDGWMESKGHRENIVSPIFQDCGVAIIEGATTGKTTGWSVVVLFGRARPPVPQRAQKN